MISSASSRVIRSHQQSPMENALIVSTANPFAIFVDEKPNPIIFYETFALWVKVDFFFFYNHLV